jgi:hypothetical protein
VSVLTLNLKHIKLIHVNILPSNAEEKQRSLRNIFAFVSRTGVSQGPRDNCREGLGRRVASGASSAFVEHVALWTAASTKDARKIFSVQGF